MSKVAVESRKGAREHSRTIGRFGVQRDTYNRVLGFVRCGSRRVGARDSVRVDRTPFRDKATHRAFVGLRQRSQRPHVPTGGAYFRRDGQGADRHKKGRSRQSEDLSDRPTQTARCALGGGESVHPKWKRCAKTAHVGEERGSSSRDSPWVCGIG